MFKLSKINFLSLSSRGEGRGETLEIAETKAFSSILLIPSHGTISISPICAFLGIVMGVGPELQTLTCIFPFPSI